MENLNERICKHIYKDEEKAVMGKIIFHDILKNNKALLVLQLETKDGKILTIAINEESWKTDSIITQIFTPNEIVVALLKIKYQL